ncbi:MAG: NAD-dependent DNA ligase LigA [Flavobacteriaceae bacterium]|nr:NAD-dependent DNA ligase LigA [Flavobacteriaceae bacterium]
MTEREEIQELRKEIQIHNHKYYILDQPEISDYEFDLKLKRLEELERLHPELYDEYSPTVRVGGSVTKNFENKNHPNRMYSLDNAYSYEELETWYRRCLNAIRDETGREQIEISCELKYDGASINLIYENGKLSSAITRGDGFQGDVVTANIKTVRTVPLELRGHFPASFEIRGEVILEKSEFERINSERSNLGLATYMNPRNTASGSLKLQDSGEVAKRKLTCLPYAVAGENLPFKTQIEVLESLAAFGFKIPDHYRSCKNLNEVQDFIAYWAERKNNLPFEIDGIVLKVNALEDQELLGATSKSPRWALAYKFESENAITRLVDVVYQVGRTGAITPVAQLEPVLLAGTIVKRASLHNKDQIDKLDLCFNDRVYVEKGGEIIPKIVAVVSGESERNERVSFIEHCPECETPLSRIEGEAQHYCPNTEYCPPQIKGRIQHFISRNAMDIDGLGSETVSQLVDEGLINRIEDLYQLKAEELIVLDRMAQKSVENLLEGVSKSKDQPFAKVLFGIGIRHVGQTVAKTLAKEFKSIDQLSQATFDELIAINEIGPRIAESVLSFFALELNQITIERLKQEGLNFEVIQNDQVQKKQLFEGKSIVVSGVFSNFSRSELKQLIEELGGKNVSSISSKTDLLIAGDQMGPAKRKKAEALNIPMLSEIDLENKLKELSDQS